MSARVKLAGALALVAAMFGIWFPLAAGVLMTIVWAHTCIDMERQRC